MGRGNMRRLSTAPEEHTVARLHPCRRRFLTTDSAPGPASLRHVTAQSSRPAAPAHLCGHILELQLQR